MLNHHREFFQDKLEREEQRRQQLIVDQRNIEAEAARYSSKILIYLGFIHV